MTVLDTVREHPIATGAGVFVVGVALVLAFRPSHAATAAPVLNPMANAGYNTQAIMANAAMQTVQIQANAAAFGYKAALDAALSKNATAITLAGLALQGHNIDESVIQTGQNASLAAVQYQAQVVGQTNDSKVQMANLAAMTAQYQTNTDSYKAQLAAGVAQNHDNLAAGTTQNRDNLAAVTGQYHDTLYSAVDNNRAMYSAEVAKANKEAAIQGQLIARDIAASHEQAQVQIAGSQAQTAQYIATQQMAAQAGRYDAQNIAAGAKAVGDVGSGLADLIPLALAFL